MIWVKHHYQAVALQHLLDNRHAGLFTDNAKSGLFLEMGLGKSVVALTAVNIWLNQTLEAEKVLIIGPKRVVDSVWAQEGAKWDHLKHLTFSKVLGTAEQRIAALRKNADVYLINRENVAWLDGFYRTKWPFNVVIVDESSSFKDGSSKRFRSLRHHLGRIDRLVLLTGTPIGNGLMDLWAQIYMLDQGERLYDTMGQYRMRYFHNPEYKYIPLKGAEELIYEKLQGIVISMKNSDYLKLPERIDVTVPVIFEPEMQKKYDEFERDCIMKLNDQEITAINSGVLSGKLLQFSNGAIYDSEKKTHFIHDKKIEALAEIIDSAGGKPVLVFYNYRHDLDRIVKAFGAKTFDTDKDVLNWNAGKIPVAVAHPASAGHGLNLQECANIIVWFGLNWSLELYQQANARLWRQGQKQKVYIYHIVAEKTMDGEVMDAIAKKANGQAALMEAVKARIEKYLHLQEIN